MTDLNNNPEWIRSANSLDKQETADMNAQRGRFLPINDDLVFDLKAWLDSEASHSNRYDPLPKRQREALEGSIRDKGVEVAVDLDEGSYDVVDGHHRLAALFKARGTDASVSFTGFNLRKFQNQAERHDFEDRRAFAHRHLSRAQKKVKIYEFLRRHPNWSDSRIGNHLHVTGDTVQAHSRKLEEEDSSFSRPTSLLDVNDRAMEMMNLKPNKTKNVAKLSKDKEPDYLRLFLDAWWNEFGLIVVFVKDLTRMAIRRRLRLPDGQATGKMTEKAIQLKLGRMLRSHVGKSIADRKIVFRLFTSNSYVYQLVPVKYWKDISSE